MVEGEDRNDYGVLRGWRTRWNLLILRGPESFVDRDG